MAGLSSVVALLVLPLTLYPVRESAAGRNSWVPQNPPLNRGEVDCTLVRFLEVRGDRYSLTLQICLGEV